MKADKNPQIKRINSYLKKAGEFYPSDRSKSLAFAEKAHQLLKNVNYPKGKVEYYMIAGRVMRDSGNTSAAGKYFLKAKKIYAKMGDKAGIGNVFFSTSMNEVMQGNHEKALKASTEALKIFEELGTVKEICLTVVNMAYIYNRLGDPATGLSIIFEMADKYNIRENPFLKQIAYVSISDMYIGMDMIDESIKYLEECRDLKSDEFTEYHKYKIKLKIAKAFLQKKRYGEALVLFHKVLKYDKKTGHKIALLNTYNDIGLIYERLKNYPRALKYFSLSRDIASEIKDNYNLANVIINMVHIYLYLGKYNDAIENLNEALKLAKQTGAQGHIGECYLLLYKTYKKKKDIATAFSYLEKHIAIHEKKYKEETKQLSENLQKVYEFKIRAREAEILKDKNEKLNDALHKVEIQNKELEELNIEKSELLRIVAHDIKNPSSNISGLANVLLEEGREIDSGEYNELLKNIINCSSQIEGIISNILRSSSLEDATLKPSLEKIDVSKLIHDTIALNENKAEQKSIKILFEESSKVYLVTDKTFLQQILDNLISNAIKFSHTGEPIRIKLQQDNSSVYIKVIDAGPGIKPEEKSKLFQKYTRLSSKPTKGESSTGLGLSIVKKLIDILKGEIWCESEFGNGSEFIVLLPKS